MYDLFCVVNVWWLFFNFFIFGQRMDFLDDDEEFNVFQVKRVIVYGSLEEKEKFRFVVNSLFGFLVLDVIKVGKVVGNINIIEGGFYDIVERDLNEG